ncbi:MAG: oligosaccharide flippase family protein [Epulopiscium sp.]|nr:oligosaccharide flippase family protein [Candidatus Epulonipiscium sp.]
MGFKEKNFKALSKTKVSQSIVQSLIHILFGFFNMGPIALIIGRILGQSAGTITLAIPFLDKDRKLIKKINRKDIFWSAKRYIKFPLISSISQFLNTASIQLPVLFISSQYGNKAIGFYGLANSIINLPTTLIGNAVGDVFYGEAASVGNQDPLRLKQLSIEVLKKLMIIGLVPLIIIVLFGPYLFLFVFGVEWKEAGIYARIISFLAYARLIFIPVSRIYSIFERQKEAFLMDALRVILVIIVFTITNYLNLNSLYAVSLYSFSISLVYLITFLVSQKIINYEINKVS